MQSNTKHYKNHSYISNERLDYKRISCKNAPKTSCRRQKKGHLVSKTARSPSIYYIVCYENRSYSKDQNNALAGIALTSAPRNAVAGGQHA
jgi:hypothetical protein